MGHRRGGREDVVRRGPSLRGGGGGNEEKASTGGGPPELILDEATATGEWGVSDAGQRGEEETLFDNVAARGIFARDESPLEMSPTAMTSPTTTPPTTPPNSYLTPPHCPLVAAPRPHTPPPLPLHSCGGGFN